MASFFLSPKDLPNVFKLLVKMSFHLGGYIYKSLFFRMKNLEAKEH